MPDEVADVPGGEMRHRPVHFFWILDCSSSMKGEKIGQLNFALREAIPEMRRVAEENPKASLLVRAVTFSTGADWHIEVPVQIDDFTWQDVHADGVTDLGKALDLVAAQLEMPPMPERALPPVLALLSDGQPTDDWKSALARLERTPWAKKAIRVAVAIGKDADVDVLKAFLANPELEPYPVHNSVQLAKAIRWASTVAVKAASTPREDASGQPAAPQQPIPTTTDDDDDEVW